MSYQITSQIEEHSQYILVTFFPPHNSIEDVKNALQEQIKLLKEWTSFPAYVIVDLSRISMNFREVVEGLGQVRLSSLAEPVMSLEIVTILVGTHELIQLVGQSVRQEQYGGLQTKIVATLAEAQAYVREATSVLTAE